MYKTDIMSLQIVGLMCIIIIMLLVTGAAVGILIDMYYDRRSRFEAFKAALRINEQQERKQKEV